MNECNQDLIIQAINNQTTQLATDLIEAYKVVFPLDFLVFLFAGYGFINFCSWFMRRYLKPSNDFDN